MRRDDKPSNFPGLKDPDRQSRFGRLADRDVTLGHAREWSRQRMMTARQLADQIEAIKQSQRRDVAAASEWDGSPGRSKSDSLREDLEKALIKPQLLAASAPLVTVIPSTALGKVAAGGVGAALGGIGGEDPYFSALSMLHPVAAMGQMANAMYNDKPLVPISEAEADKLRLFSGLSTPNKLNRAFHASTDPAYASKRAMQMSKLDDPMFVHTPKVDDSKLVQFGKTYDTRRAPEAFTNFPRSESISGEDVYEALRPYADEHADSVVRGMGYVGFERPNTGSFGNGRWFRISDPDGVEQSFAGGGLAQARKIFDAGRNYVAKLPASQRELVQDYVSGQHEVGLRKERHAWVLNEKLRKGIVPPEALELDEILRGAPRTDDYTSLYRGQWLDVGKDPGYLSTSTDKLVADAYADALNSIGEGRAAGTVELVVPPRTPLVAPDLDDMYMDNELLLPRGIDQKVLSGRNKGFRLLQMPEGYAGGGSVGGGLNLLKKALTGQLGLDAGTSHVIKNKGGNWLTGSVEGALKGLKKPETPRYVHINDAGQAVAPEYGRPMTAEELAPTLQRMGPNKALNNWIDKQLTRYVKNEMATPEDPIRALAERGILHMPPDEDGLYVHRGLENLRVKAGYPEEGLGRSELARQWENASDIGVSAAPAETYQNAIVGNDLMYSEASKDWLAKVPPDTPLYRLRGNADLGFSHLTDELSNALRASGQSTKWRDAVRRAAESGVTDHATITRITGVTPPDLPAHLALDPKSLPRVSVPQAVERVAQINAWRAAQKAEADALRANNAATRVHKEYPEKGMKWVELRKQPLPEGWTQEGTAYVDPANPSKWVYPEESLQDALRYEGDTMGHCVGGYCDDVLSGRTQIYSLRDAKGQPHVTVEIRPGSYGGYSSVEAFRDALIAKGKDAPQENLDELVRTGAFDPSIVQIKGKGNAKPNDEYLPFVQDFVKSGKWSDVGDLQNTGLSIHAPTGRYITDDEAWGISKRHFRPGGMSNRPDDLENPFQYYNRVSRYDQDMLSDVDKAFIEDWKAGNFAHGGTVNTNNLTVGRLRDIIASLNQEQTDA